MTGLGECYRLLGKFGQAIDQYDQALAIDRQIGDRAGEATDLGSLGNCHYELGQIPLAIDLYQQALAISQEVGHRQSEAVHLGNLANCYRDLGQVDEAIDLYKKALAIAQEVGYELGEAIHLGNLGACYRDLGQVGRATDLFEQSLAIDRRISYRYGEAMDLLSLGEARADLGLWDQGAGYCRQAIEVADAIGSAQAQSEARRSLARIQLLGNNAAAALQEVTEAREHDYPPARAGLALLAGIAWLRQGQPAPAATEFHAAIAHADGQLKQTSGDFQALDVKALALCGLVLTTGPSHAAEARTVFRAARAITSADGIVNQTLAIFNTLAATDRDGTLGGIRPAVTGSGTGD
jgi:tetratricopeptide (TPR) repeat protein